MPSDPVEIVATLGPSSWKLPVDLARAGATELRINASHLDPQALSARISAVRQQLPEIPIIVDLQGAKMRLGLFTSKRVEAGQRIRFSMDAREDAVPVPHPEIFNAVKAGETLSCDDDRLTFCVLATTHEVIEAVCLSSGELKPRKGINVLEHPVHPAGLSAFDAECVKTASRFTGISYAFSFMKDGSEAGWVRQKAPSRPVTGKIERAEATLNAAAIAGRVDKIWICRGDLGAQIGPVAMARWIAGYNPRMVECPVFMAGQVLEHLTAHAEPTRSEVCHLFSLVRAGYRGFVLSDETAVGTDPVRAVATLRNLVDQMAE